MGSNYSKKEKKGKMFMGLNRVFNTKQHKTKINFKTKVKFPQIDAPYNKKQNKIFNP